MRHLLHPSLAHQRALHLVLTSTLFIAALFSTPGVVAQGARRGVFRAEYTVEVRNVAARLFHVSATFSNLRQPYLDLALPVWTPGVYRAANYALNVRRFTVLDQAGNRLRAPKVQPSTWRIETRGLNQVTVEFDYIATDLSWNGAAITPRFAFFTGTQLFLEPVGHRNTPPTVRFHVPGGWGIASALHETSDSTVFTARDYDELVDAPTVLGSFDVTRLEAEGKPHFIVRAPADAQCTDNWPRLMEAIPKIIAVQRSIFGSLPYDKYVFFCVADLDGGSLEHGNSFVTSELGAVNIAHEFFHLWNVKRIRPAEMWPYDYSRVNPGPSLWVAEGITSYYEAMTAYRAGLDQGGDIPAEGVGPEVAGPVRDAEHLLIDHLAFRISGIEGNPERQYYSPSDASTSDGLSYGGGAWPNYYWTGEILGALLDLSILRDTHGRRRLDDVMRALYTQRYEKGRGFTPDDLIRIVSATAGRDYTDFFRRYVTGTEVPPYERIFGYAGYRLSHSTRKFGALGGINARSTPEGRRAYQIAAGSRAARAGIQVGDVILSVNGVPIHQVPLMNLYGKNWIGGTFVGRAGEPVVLKILRDGKEQDIPVTLGAREETNFRIENDPAATTEQLSVRSAWLKR